MKNKTQTKAEFRDEIKSLQARLRASEDAHEIIIEIAEDIP